MKIKSIPVHAGNTIDKSTGALNPAIHLSSTYKFNSFGNHLGYDYSRADNPTRDTLEGVLADLENSKFALSFSSGMAAIDAVLRLLHVGDKIICGEDIYGGTYRYLEHIKKGEGIEYEMVDLFDLDLLSSKLTGSVKLLWLEVPSNPLLKVPDLKSIIKLCSNNGVLCCVDSTFATPILLRPLELGADIVVHSTTKYLSGHHQLIGGSVNTNNQQLFDQLKFIQKSVGAIPSPYDCFNLMIGIKTLALRVEQSSRNAFELADFLQNQKMVDKVFYPGLVGNKENIFAKDYFNDLYGGMLSFYLKGDIHTVEKFCNSLNFVVLAESLGSVETMINHPATMTHASIPENHRLKIGVNDQLLRVSVGIEDIDDIINDFESAFSNL